jgi:hypothetical protein
VSRHTSPLRRVPLAALVLLLGCAPLYVIYVFVVN